MSGLRMLPNDEAQHLANLGRASASQMELARCFQRLAFPDKFGDFQPAPLYLRQAMAIVDDADVARELLRTINQARRAGPSA